ncbi:MAG: hypothetical protein ACLTMP_04690 [Eggerthella lenta]
MLAEAGYPVTLVAPDLAERLHAEPARSAALETFARAAEDGLPLSVLIAPDADVLADAVDEAEAVVDALLGTGFSGGEVREPYAGWIRAANRRRFEGRRQGRGRHRAHARARRARTYRGARCLRGRGRPVAVAADVPAASRRKPMRRGRRSPPMHRDDARLQAGSRRFAGAQVGAVKLAKLGVDASKLEAERVKASLGWGAEGGHAVPRGEGEGAHAHYCRRFESERGGFTRRRDDGRSDGCRAALSVGKD